ncbi:hypothetical protein CABS02_00912 [Colletotrichum abscissum]|uniref:Uncharacterized protein n=1 Tax=Colletotrichum abscissum TaxID=1671311 RepID=A0A9Q0BAJ0_9PEZI|nr:hypothetical protein CABS02_00912 [Colletotrichum abscissum]
MAKNVNSKGRRSDSPAPTPAGPNPRPITLAGPEKLAFLMELSSGRLRGWDSQALKAPQYCFSHKPRLPSYANPLNIGLMDRPSAAKETTFSA